MPHSCYIIAASHKNAHVKSHSNCKMKDEHYTEQVFTNQRMVVHVGNRLLSNHQVMQMNSAVLQAWDPV